MSTHSTILPGTGADRATIGSAFSPRHNSLNFIRLALAVAVVFSHSITLGFFGSEVILGKTTLGTIAVYGFFGLSGFLIAGSASRNGVGRYLWQRFLRIFPGFWICLVVTAFVFGSIAWWHQNPVLARSCGFHCYLTEPGGPVGYVIHNFLLRVNQPAISGTLQPGIFRDVWNGSLWTLFFEIPLLLDAGGTVCARLVATPGPRSPSWHLGLTSLRSSSRRSRTWPQTLSPSHNWYVMQMFTFVPIFLTGSLLFLYKEKIPDSGLVAAVSTGLSSRFRSPCRGRRSRVHVHQRRPHIGIPRLPPALAGDPSAVVEGGSANDYSYGIYVYVFPVQQLLVFSGVSRWGYWPYTLVTLLVLAPVRGRKLVGGRERRPGAEDDATPTF